MKCCCVKMADEVVGKSRSNGSIYKSEDNFFGRGDGEFDIAME